MRPELDTARQRVVEIIRKDPHILDVIPGKQDTELRRFIDEYDFTKYGEEAQDVRSCVGHLLSYIEGPVITDSFENHPDRRAWRGEMVQKCWAEGLDFEEFYNRNQLRIGPISVVPMDIDLLSESGIVFPEALLEEAKSIGLATKRYDRLSNDNKLEIVGRVKNVARKAITSVCSAK